VITTHEKGCPFSNRSHNLRERIAGEALLDFLIRFIEPKRIIAIGNDAYRTASKLSCGQSVIKVRHPSYGGQTEFLKSMNTLYNITN
jgi:uracil-DNA glycosylase